MKKSLWIVLLLALVCTLALSACDDTNQPQTPNEDHVHAFGEWTTVKDSTCTVKGEQERICSCGEKETKSIDATGHTEVIDAAVDPACNATGLTEGKHCSVCNETIVAQEVVAKLEHTPATDAAVAPTCTETGLTEGTHCSVCNEVITKQEIVKANGHTWGVWSQTKAPNCTEKGEERRDCDVCDHYETREVNANGHTESEFVVDVAATIYSEGMQHTYCTVCNSDIQTEVVIPRIVSNGLAYEVNADGATCTITGIGTCTDTEIGIPDTIDGYKVTAIGENAFGNCSSVTAIVLSNNIKSIGNRAFYKTSIAEISLPASINKIGTQIFYGCNNLTTVYYAASYSPSQDTVFFNVSSIKTIVFNGSYVPSYICYDCDNIQTIVLADTVTSIGSYAFYECGNLKDLPYSENLNSIGGHSFERSGVETIHFSENVYIGYGAFFYCYELTSITFEGKVSNGWGPFRHCSAIPQINVPDLETWVYLQKLSLGGYDYEPFVATTLYIDGTLLKNAIIPDTISVIPNFLFYNNQAIKSVVIPDSVSSIGKSAFYNCDNLVQLVLAESVGTIADSAFSSCNNLSLVFYSASEDDWNLIDIGPSNSSLTNATIYYDHNSIQ